MNILIVVDCPRDWKLHVQGVQVISARDYLREIHYSGKRGAKVFNLCRSYRYQSTGYYVSLLASARGHRPLPSINTIQDLKSQSMLRLVSDDLVELIQKSMSPIKSKEFVLSIYFGRNLARRYEHLSRQLFNLFPAPLLRARFVRHRRWQLTRLAPIAAKEIPEAHHDFVVEAASAYFARRQRSKRRRSGPRYDLAILHNPDEVTPPSNARALKRFARAAADVGFAVEFITRDDYGRLAEFDALFIRETTNVNHYTFRFAQRAAAEGLVVVDDPDSILRCTNKVYLAELLARHRVRAPRTTVVARENLSPLMRTIELPCILKQPDSAFSAGVIKVNDGQSFLRAAKRMLDRSDLIIAQEFLPTEFDWRVGVFNKKPIYVCRYYMAGSHWQIVRRDEDGRTHEGKAETLSVDEVPPHVLRSALRTANLIGDGLYGVDLKQIGRKIYVIEVNDNPNIDAGVEDAVLHRELYETIMQVLMQRVEARKK